MSAKVVVSFVYSSKGNRNNSNSAAGCRTGKSSNEKDQIGKWGALLRSVCPRWCHSTMSLLVYYTKREFDFGPYRSPTLQRSPMVHQRRSRDSWKRPGVQLPFLETWIPHCTTCLSSHQGNYFLFTPLLPSAPVGTVDITSITESVRNIARRTPGEVVYLEAEALSVDPENKSIKARYVTEKEGERTNLICHTIIWSWVWGPNRQLSTFLVFVRTRPS